MQEFWKWYDYTNKICCKPLTMHVASMNYDKTVIGNVPKSDNSVNYPNN